MPDMTRVSDPDGRTFASGRYVVKRLLGQGAQKSVYLVDDTVLGRQCALSMLNPILLGPNDVDRIRQEAQTMAQFGTHQNIVTVYDYGEEDGSPFIVSEFVPGGELRDELASTPGPLPLERALTLAMDICRALAFAHGRDIVHRDLKPENVWLTEDGSAKLGDFGIALSAGRTRLTMPGGLTGTAMYMAPEQASGGEIDARSDLYALGALLYELVTGRPPFVGDNANAIMYQHINTNPESPATHNPSVPDRLERVIMKLLAKAKTDRFGSADEVLAELERSAKGAALQRSDSEPGPPGPTEAEQGGEGQLGDKVRRTIRKSASPEGIVTVLFTDIVGSTSFRQRLGDDAAQDRFRRHNQVVREQIGKHDGFVVKTQGDGFMVAFSDVVEALACTVAIQRAVSEDNEQNPDQELKVRMGLNCGQAIKEEADFFGGAVIVAARISAIAQGGQILVSEAVRVLAGLPQGIAYVRHGRHRLKGLDGSYDVWSVNWGGQEARRFAKLWANLAFRVSMLALVPVIIGAGVAGAFVLGGNGGDPGAEGALFQEVTGRFRADLLAHVVGGDCISEDVIIEGAGEGEFTSDVSSGHLTITGEVIAYAATQCQTGYSSYAFTLTDADENTISGTVEGPFDTLSFLSNAPILTDRSEPVEFVRASRSDSELALTITGGSGIFEGSTGTGTCTGIVGGTLDPGGSAVAGLDGDCTIELAAAGALAGLEPLIVQLAASPLKVAVSGGSFDPGSTVGLAVLYGNTQEEVLTGLSVRLLAPEGAEIRSGTLGEAQELSAGERVWQLPDLAPGELTRFEFRVQILAAENPTVALIATVDGEGFDVPIASDPVTIEVVVADLSP